MPDKRILGRLLRLRELEEELNRMSLEAAARARELVSREMVAVTQWQTRGRDGFRHGVWDADEVERMGAMVDMEQAQTQRKGIDQKLEDAELEVARQHQEYLLRRTSRLQVETLVEDAHQLEEAEAGRRAQQMLDDWYGRKARQEDVQLVRQAREEGNSVIGGKLKSIVS